MLDRILSRPLVTFVVLFLVGLLLAVALVNVGSSLDPSAKGKGKHDVSQVAKGKG